ncbi:hypothetical protein [Pedobacter cryoconitis]|uniref:Uncharacterized protein n=1 Tax=Pedobacter cryoconitis TaxID=188932 RepID=A0A327S5K1_9SPHI|nr:hypothetical protein [Pedobacter cryoconitis]RAJ20997.1 hypothetical protein LY11_05047 [Pedobacter cryoconitis]
MKPNFAKQSKAIPPTEQESIDSMNAKHTYNHVCVFHETILHILGNSDVSGLKVTELKSIEYFALTIIRLLDAEKISDSVKSQYKAQIAKNTAEVRKITPKKGNDFQATKSLHDLLNWINFTNYRTRLTIEMILDDYYYHFPIFQNSITMQGHFIQQTASQ